MPAIPPPPAFLLPKLLLWEVQSLALSGRRWSHHRGSDPAPRGPPPGLGCSPTPQPAAPPRGLAPPRGPGTSFGGFFQDLGCLLVLSPCAGSGCRMQPGLGLLYGTGLCCLPLLGLPSNLVGGVGFLVFFGFFLFLHGFLSAEVLAGCAGNYGAGVYPAAETVALWRCAALSPWPEGQGGTPRWHRRLPPPPAWERRHLAVSAQAPGKACRRVCPLARGCASWDDLAPKKTRVLSARRPLLFSPSASSSSSPPAPASPPP